MVVTAGGMVNGPGAGPVDCKEKAEGIEEKGGRGELPLRHVLPYLAWPDLITDNDLSIQSS